MSMACNLSTSAGWLNLSIAYILSGFRLEALLTCRAINENLRDNPYPFSTLYLSAANSIYLILQTSNIESRYAIVGSRIIVNNIKDRNTDVFPVWSSIIDYLPSTVVTCNGSLS